MKAKTKQFSMCFCVYLDNNNYYKKWVYCKSCKKASKWFCSRSRVTWRQPYKRNLVLKDKISLKFLDGALFHFRINLSSYGLNQACTTYGPRAICGPRRLFIWPAYPEPVGILLDFSIQTPLEWVKNIDFGPWGFIEIFFGPPWDLSCASLL